MTGTPPPQVYFLVPDGIDDLERVSGGNVYDRHVRDGLRSDGWDLRVLLVPDARGSLTATLSRLPHGCVVVIDGLIAVREPEAMMQFSSGLRMVVLAHMVASILSQPGARPTAPIDREREALRPARRVIATSNWTRTELISRCLLQPGQVAVAQPGTDPVAATVASRSGGRLLCVGVVAPHKGQDLLVNALARLADVDGWACTLAGSLDAAPHFVAELRHDLERSGLTDRVTFTGVLDETALDVAYGGADLVVVPSRSESYGMVVAEALARGIPVVAADVGGISEAMRGSAAGTLVPPEDAWALEVVIRQWWARAARRAELSAAALQARDTARPWGATTAIIAETRHEVALSGSAVSA
jgi:glycosyltransferase involved in cell wall biosynthesis